MPTRFSSFETAAMRRALEIARRGEGFVEPNPLVGAVVLAADGRVIGEGWHERFGGPHAEVVALAAAGPAARGATLVVTLEPCCHHGKTPPCTDAIIAAGVSRVVVAADDPFPRVRGGGIATLAVAGVTVETGLLEREARRLTAPYRKLVVSGMPWVIAKWAETADGRLTPTGEGGRWISSPESRRLVHDLRRRVDAIVVGIGTALADDPLLTARPPGGRTLCRIVLDGRGRLPLDGALVRTAREAPVLVAVGPAAAPEQTAALEAAGCEVWRAPTTDRAAALAALLRELGTRRLTNVLVEGGPTVLATLFAAGLADEVWRFTAGGAAAPTREPLPVPPLDVEDTSRPGGDTLVRGLVRRP
jgi:diaminohydroxyphosphoribosylaminopyrimidine deaminase/5-amino-6-(5-phosphoribosylamino)uracil reductase